MDGELTWKVYPLSFFSSSSVFTIYTIDNIVLHESICKYPIVYSAILLYGKNIILYTPQKYIGKKKKLNFD